MSDKSLNTYDIIENEKGEILVLLYEGKEAPETPTFFVNKHEKYIKITRNSTDIVLIEDLDNEHIKKISKQECLYVCELKYDENLKEGDESEIVYAYSALPKSKVKTTKSKETKKTTTSTENKEEQEHVEQKANENLKEKISKIKKKYQQNKTSSESNDTDSK